MEFLRAVFFAPKFPVFCPLWESAPYRVKKNITENLHFCISRIVKSMGTKYQPVVYKTHLIAPGEVVAACCHPLVSQSETSFTSTLQVLLFDTNHFNDRRRLLVHVQSEPLLTVTAAPSKCTQAVTPVNPHGSYDTALWPCPPKFKKNKQGFSLGSFVHRQVEQFISAWHNGFGLMLKMEKSCLQQKLSHQVKAPN